MNCEQALNLISARIDREIDAGDEALLSAHLLDCAACRSLEESLRAQDAELRRAYAGCETAGTAVAERVVMRLRAEPAVEKTAAPRLLAMPKLRLPPLAWALAAAASLAGFALGLTWAYRPAEPVREVVKNDEPNRDTPVQPVAAVTPAASILEEKLVPRRREPLRTPPLAVGSRLQTKAGEQRRVALPDGSILYVHENTSLEVSAERSLKLSEGRVFVDVAPKADGASKDPLVVQAPDRSYTALGTKFEVSTKDNRSGVVVAQSQVQVSGIEQAVSAGQGVLAVEAMPTSVARPAAALIWLRDLMAAESPLVPASSYRGGALSIADPNGQETRLVLRKSHLDVFIEDGFARTTIDQTYFNHVDAWLEGTFAFALPADASVSRLAMYVDGKLMEAGLVERDRAREAYEEVVAQQRDPALLEWAEGNTFRLRVSSLEPQQEKRIILSYTQRLESFKGRKTYRFPAGDGKQQVEDWSFHAHVRGAASHAWMSHTHPLNAASDGPDLVLNASAKAVKADRDLVLTLAEPPGNAPVHFARFSSAEVDGTRYLMLRYQPQLDAPPRRERRDWVFLFEASGDRDPLLARVQADVVRTLLDNAEHDDTFALLTAGRRVRQFAPEARPATPANIKAAAEFLDQTHLVGALDLGGALAAAEPLLKNAKNPYLVHVGSGIAALGEKREEVLARRVPSGTRYIGVAVGRRWARGFMKPAAERSGGYFTQINPDEPVAWRAFELASILNAPRLQGVKVVDNAERVNFLCYADSLADGDELCAVARFEARVPPPTSVTVTGLLDGQPFSRILPVQSMTPRADYLPRTWAQWEIERLLAEDSANRDRVIELSQAMHVMTPLTSLLVLESEEMYKQHNVPPGRGDQWALYSAPPQLVTQPAPAAGSKFVGAKDGTVRRSRGEVLKSILGREANRTALHAEEMKRSWFGVPPPVRLQYENSVRAHPTTALVVTPDRSLEAQKEDVSSIQKAPDKKVAPGLEGAKAQAAAGKPAALPTPSPKDGGGTAPPAAAVKPLATAPAAPGGGAPMPAAVPSPPAPAGARGGPPNRGADSQRAMLPANTPTVPTPQTGDTARRFLEPSRDKTWNVGNLPLREGGEAADASLRLAMEEEARALGALSMSRPNTAYDKNQFGGLAAPSLDAALSEQVRARRKTLREQPLQPDDVGKGDGRYLYRRPAAGTDAEFFVDLVARAPGMNTRQEDVRAVLEAEATPEAAGAPGTIDAAARRLIEKARAAGWQAVTVPAQDQRLAFDLIFDGSGRYRYERTLADGLRELVLSDGKTLLHLYPELGLGSRRSMSRHHFADLSGLVPWVLPAPEDLARGADLKQAGDNAVMIVSHPATLRQTTGDGVSPSRMKLVFGADGRLTEQQTYDRDGSRLLARETYSDKGEIQTYDASGKQSLRRSLRLRPAQAPNLKPDTTVLVVLPLPYRTAASILESPEAANRSYEALDDSVALSLFAAYCIEDPAEALILYQRRFHNRSPRVVGFHTLLAAADLPPEGRQLHQSLAGQHLNEPLVKYLAAVSDPQPLLQQSLGNLGLPAGGLAQRLATMHDLALRLQPGRPADASGNLRQAEVERARAYLNRNTVSADQWSFFMLVREQDRQKKAALDETAQVLAKFAQVPELGYSANYELGTLRAEAGDVAQAQELLLDLHAQALKEGRVPPIDQRFRQALRADAKNPHRWEDFVRKTTAALIEAKRWSDALGFAWQCRELGDGSLADQVVEQTRAAASPTNGELTKAAVDYYRKTGRLERADDLLQRTLARDEAAKDSALLRLSAEVAEARGALVRSVAALERALDGEQADPKKGLDLTDLRQGYGQLLGGYRQIGAAYRLLDATPPPDFRVKVVRAADRWRAADPDPTEACQAAARVLRAVGEKELALDYLTTPLSLHPNDPAPHLRLAQALQEEGDRDLAEGAYAAAAEAEPRNARIVWERAQNLSQAGRPDEAQALYQRLANQTWPSRYQPIQQQARQRLTAAP